MIVSEFVVEQKPLMPPAFPNLGTAHLWFIKQRPFIPRLVRYPGPDGNLLIYELAYNAWPGRSPDDPKFQEASYADAE